MNNRRHLLACTAVLLSGCTASPHGADPAPARGPAASHVTMCSGADLRWAILLDEARLMRVYASMSPIDDDAADKRQLMFPPAVAGKIGLTKKQINRLFEGAIEATHRFQVFDDATTAVRSGSHQTFDGKLMDIAIDGLVVGANQEIITLDKWRKVRTTVRLSVHVVDVLSGELLLPSDVVVTGEYGLAPGEGTPLPPGTDLKSSDIQESMAHDYERALQRAFAETATRIDQVVRPVGKVVSADARSLTMIGGSRQGFQDGDRIVVFSAQWQELPQEGTDGTPHTVKVFSNIQPLALAQCRGVTSLGSQCDLTKVEAVPQKDNYAVLCSRGTH